MVNLTLTKTTKNTPPAITATIGMIIRVEALYEELLSAPDDDDVEGAGVVGVG